MLLEASTEIDEPPDVVFRFFEEIEDRYREWHPDHVTFRWVTGEGLEVGNEAYFEEWIGGELQERTIRYTTVEPNRYIEFKPTGRLIGLFVPHISFTVEPEDGGCRVTQRIKVRTGPIGRRLNRKEFDAVREHMNEEAENLKRIVEREF
jgi:uncharacterized protein YndB with AHSA1/START domain